MEAFPKRSILIRETGVLAPSIAAASVTVDALSSMATSSTSLRSRARSTSVSTINLLSRLKEYCTLENVACTE